MIIVFVVYLGLVAAITVLPARLTAFHVPSSNHVNLVPLDYSFRCFLIAPRQQVTSFCLKNTVGNLLLFLPLGILLPIASPRFQNLRSVVLFALCMSLSIETIQFILRFFGNLRSVDIDDVLLNTLGAAVGFVLYRIVTKSRR
ncbi:MAG TPA: VanZ family protein [Pyrinomonadaceae bacterium]|nr:VanZ family protein [Pyrinomonadaceae bacterium]